MEAISLSLELIGKINDMVEKYGANKKAVQDLEVTTNLIGRLYAPIKGMCESIIIIFIFY